jgi:hypothetical protein
LSNGNTSGVAVGGFLFGTLFVVLAVAAGGWFGMAYHYGQQRLEVRDRVLATAEWTPQRVQRAGMTADCDAGRLREEAEARLADVGVFDLGKVDRFPAAPNDQRARELQRTIKQMDPGIQAFLQASECSANSRFARLGREQSLSGPLLARAIQVDAWLEPARVPDLQKVLWVGRDIQATGGLYEFREGALVMDAAYTGLQRSLATGDADASLDAIQAQLVALVGAEESAQLQWRAGARILLADLLGPEWDANPPTPLRARAMIDSMDDVIASLEAMPDVANQPFPARRQAMTEWAEKHDMSTWDQRFRGFGKAGVEIDELATQVASRGRALLIAVALRNLKKKKGSCPKDLEELVTAGILTAIPIDPVTDAPFTYDRDACRVTSTAGESHAVTASAVAFP